MLKLVKYAVHESFHAEKPGGENVTHEKLWQWNSTASHTEDIWKVVPIKWSICATQSVVTRQVLVHKLLLVCDEMKKEMEKRS